MARLILLLGEPGEAGGEVGRGEAGGVVNFSLALWLIGTASCGSVCWPVARGWVGGSALLVSAGAEGAVEDAEDGLARGDDS